MVLVIVLILLVIGSVLFHFMSPWYLTPIASNWGMIDDTLTITFIVCGFVFVVVNLFMAYSIYKYRYRKDRRADYEPENQKLEWWLTAFTTVGVIAMLAPGLIVWGKYVDVPEDAMLVEAIGQQWRWTYRYPGADGVFGTVDTRNVSASNPFGLNPDDPNGQDDLLASGAEVHLPIGGPVKVTLRSKDVLHDFYVPQIRSKMDLVPGMITYFWFTPTKIGEYDVLCAELCGSGHYNMRSRMVIEEEADFQAWLQTQPTFAQLLAGVGSTSGGTPIEQGEQLAKDQGCLACHSLDGGAGVGPTWKGLVGKNETLIDGSSVLVDEAYLRESIVNPNAKVVKGYAPIMPPAQLTDDQLDALMAYLKSASG
ncbi:MAG: cytochrome c oxidase subunit II [Acidiferrobacteraceae bacterium]|jgi:cytochrome c oxidase subunit 2|nr:cytochrome c oxidase subunit II [Acidiferrobacteraceae bacterium]